MDDFTHPGLRRIRFVFCDDQPNENNQGIQLEDFEGIMKSSVGTPIKMKFFGDSAGNHLGSVPIGHIVSMTVHEDSGVNKLIADGILYADDYPDEVEYLSDSFSKGKAPGISWEVSYKDSLVDKGIEWLRGIVTRAATFVRNPAYGNRTAILALASNKNISDEKFLDVISKLTHDENRPKNTEQGGSNRMEEELNNLRAQVAALQESLAAKESELAEITSKIQVSESKVSELEVAISEKDSVISEYQMKEKLSSRIEELAEAGIILPDDADKRKVKEEFYLSLSDEAFASIKEELVEAIQSAKKVESPKKGLASIQSRVPAIPRLSATDESTSDVGSLKERLGSFSRTLATQSE